jgi:signal transduction histidine kinase
MRPDAAQTRDTVRSHILFVDDEPHVLEGIERSLHTYADEWLVCFADSATKATEVLAATPCDVAVVDVNMPGGSGLDLLASIKAAPQTRDTEVIILTGLRDRDLKRRALDLGATDLLVKPVMTEDLVARLRSAVRAHTDREQLRARQAQLEEELVRSQRMEVVGVLAAGLAHDLKSMLAVILGYSELTERMLPSDATARKNVEQIQTAGRRAKQLVAQIGRLAAGTPNERELCNVSAIVSECVSLLRPAMPETIDVVWQPPAACGPVAMDSTQLCQVTMNLCLNARDAMPHGGALTLSVAECELGAEGIKSSPSETDPSEQDTTARPGCLVRLRVSDTGIGMDEPTRARIFEPLFSTKRSHGGSGLGLAVVKRIITRWGGIVRVTSSLGAGTTFDVYLPLAESETRARRTSGETSHVGT